ncbi:hypothetical protein CYMTET_7642 [Cymbomonas tetramitiformis]|uniref:Ion transport domain-containing protein n=1 Tax=Cymbomonas tetramitiformis TaxID=36881 RepID=A0AAE0GVA1_9CHLO|nr:hypothetical protein CYMTET_7642 [Cymbomonas tetramitiformis]
MESVSRSLQDLQDSPAISASANSVLQAMNSTIDLASAKLHACGRVAPTLSDLDIQVLKQRLVEETSLKQARARALERYEASRTYSLPHQKWALDLYQSDLCQILLAILIFANFIVTAAEKQLGKHTDDYGIFGGFEWFFTVIFAIELLFNMYGNWFFQFYHSPWNWFDFTVVTVSLVSLAVEDLPGISILRLLRAFRVFRLFKRLESLRRIVVALESSIPGCLNAFGILIIVSAIYSILGVEFFGDVEFASDYPYYNTFLNAMLTQFQVMSGDSWAENIARPCIKHYDVGFFAAMFFVSYILIADLLLVNVVVAVLMEKFCATNDAENDIGPDELGEYLVETGMVEHNVLADIVEPEHHRSDADHHVHAEQEEKHSRTDALHPVELSPVGIRKSLKTTDLTVLIKACETFLLSMSRQLESIDARITALDKLPSSEFVSPSPEALESESPGASQQGRMEIIAFSEPTLVIPDRAL